VYLEDAKNLSITAPSVFRNFFESHSFSIKDKPGRFSSVGSDQMLEQTINISSKCSDGVISHAKQKQYIAQLDIIYHEIMSVKDVHCEYADVSERTSEAWHHHESSQSTKHRKEGHIQAIVRYTKEQELPFSTQCPPVLHYFVTKEVYMTPGMMYSMPHREAGRNLRHSTQKGSPTKPPS